MKLLINTSLDQPSWDAWLTQTPAGHFLQSWAWGDFQLNLGNKVWRVAIVEDDQTISQITIVKLSLGYGWSILYAPRANLFPSTTPLANSLAAAKLLVRFIKEIATVEKSIAFRIDPEIETANPAAISLYRELNFMPNPSKDPQPRHTAIIDLSRSPQAIFQSFHPKTRYNINLAEKKGVDAREDQTEHGLNIFVDLVGATSLRNHFVPLTDRYYHIQFDSLKGPEMEKLWLARYENNIIAGIMTITFNRRATYVHGASDKTHRHLMAPHLLQYKAMLQAKEDGATEYDLWGIHPDPNHRWSGFTRFKRGFDGTEKEYIGTLELPLSPFLYKLYRFLRR